MKKKEGKKYVTSMEIAEICGISKRAVIRKAKIEYWKLSANGYQVTDLPKNIRKQINDTF
jgi:transcriptional antiterminator